MRKTKLLAFLLCVCLLLPLAACSSGTEDGSKNPTTTGSAGNEGGGEETTTEAPESIIKSDLPEANMNGKTFTILKAGWYGNENDVLDLTPESIDAETLNDAAYKRMTEIEQQYNCNIVGIPDYNHEAAVTQVQQAVMANDNSYDVAIIRGTNFINLLMGNSYLTELTEVPHVNFEQPWWNKNIYDALAIGGKNLGIVGDISVTHVMWVWAVYFNKDIVKDYSLESPFDLVKEGRWTFDKAMEMAKAVGKDLDNNEIMDENDMWGVNFTGDTVMGIIRSAGVTIAHLDADGVPVLTIGEESNVTKLQHIYEKLRERSYCVDTLFDLGPAAGTFAGEYMFVDGRCLFMFGAMEKANALRETEVDFGLAPYPKYAESDEQYSTSGGKFMPITCIPKTNTDLENTGIFLEAFAYAGSKTIVPAFYEVILKTKMARDEESAEMIEYIFSDIRFDSGELFNFGTIAHTLGYQMSTNHRANVVSTIETNVTIMQRDIDRILDQLYKD